MSKAKKGNQSQQAGKGGNKGKKGGDDDDLELLRDFEKKVEISEKKAAAEAEARLAAEAEAAKKRKKETPIPAAQLKDVSQEPCTARGLFKRGKTADEASAAVAALGEALAEEGKAPVKQTSPPTIPVAQLFKDKIFPAGEVIEMNSTTARTTPGELRAQANVIDDTILNEVREAAEVHRQCRLDLQRFIKPGVSLLDIAERLERSTKTLLGATGSLERGWGFPTGLSLNHCAAHYSPNPGDRTVVGENDVLKVDFGTHINGRIIDCAFTVHFNPVYDNLVQAIQEATETGLRVAGVDMRLGDIGGAINEVMESYEVEIRGRTYPVKALRNLNGHDIKPYRIHGGKSVPLYNNHDQTKMEENEFFAIETFGSIAGRGLVTEDMGEISHYMQDFRHPGVCPSSVSAKAKSLFNTINARFGTLAFCRRWLEDEVGATYSLPLKQLVDAGVINPCPALNEIRGAYTAQFEHTILIRDGSKEIISRGFDY